MNTLIDQLSMGFDSTLCCIALGGAVAVRGKRLVLALLFGLSDLVASLLASLPVSHLVPMPPTALYLGFAVLVGIAARVHPRLVWAAPLVLSLDNLFGASSLSGAFVDGASSALLALAALSAGAWISRRAHCNTTVRSPLINTRRSINAFTARANVMHSTSRPTANKRSGLCE